MSQHTSLPGILLLMVLGCASLGRAADPSDTLLQKLVEKKVLTSAEAEQIRAEAAAQQTCPVTSKRPLVLSGLLQVRGTHSDKSGDYDYVEIKRARLTLAGAAAPKLDMKVQVDFAGAKSGLTGATLKTTTTPNQLTTATDSFGKPVLLDAAIGYTPYANTKITVGQFYIPFGLENITPDSTLDTINRAQANELLVPGRDNGSQGRDIGAQLGGVCGLGKTSRLNYALGLFDGAGINVKDDNNRKDVAAHLVYQPGPAGMEVGLSEYVGASGATALIHRATGGEMAVRAGAWQAHGEYIGATTGAVNKHGWYATLVRQLTAKLQGVVRYDTVSANVVAKTTDPVNGWTLGVNYALSRDGLTRCQLNYTAQREAGPQVRNNLLLAQLQTGF